MKMYMDAIFYIIILCNLAEWTTFDMNINY